MREVLLDLREPSGLGPIPTYILTEGHVYEDGGESFHPLVAADGQSLGEKPVTDFIVQTNSAGLYAFRRWLPNTVAERDIWGVLVNVNAMARSGEAQYEVVQPHEVVPLVVGEEAVFAGVSMGVAYRIISRGQVSAVQPGNGKITVLTIRSERGLTYDPFFRQVDTTLSAALGETSLYKLTADLVKKRTAIPKHD